MMINFQSDNYPVWSIGLLEKLSFWKVTIITIVTSTIATILIAVTIITTNTTTQLSTINCGTNYLYLYSGVCYI